MDRLDDLDEKDLQAADMMDAVIGFASGVALVVLTFLSILA